MAINSGVCVGLAIHFSIRMAKHQGAHSLTDRQLLEAVEETERVNRNVDVMDGALYSSNFGRYTVRVVKRDIVELSDTWQGKSVDILMNSLLNSELEVIEEKLQLMEIGTPVNNRWFIGIEVFIEAPIPLVYVQGIKMDLYAWSKFMDVCKQLEHRFPAEEKYTMSKVHQQLLQRNRMYLLNNLIISDTLIGWLYSNRVLSKCMLEEIKCPLYYTHTSKISYLLDLLPRRGPTAFHIFLEALVATEQTVIVKFLSQQL